MTSNLEPSQRGSTPLKIIGSVLAFGGIALSIYFDNFAPSAPNGNMTLASWLVFGVGMAILLVLRSTAQRSTGQHAEDGQLE